MKEYKIDYLIPYTTYEISMALSGNKYGFDDETISSFVTSEEGKCKKYVFVSFKTVN